MASHAIKEDGSLLSRIDRALFRLETLLAFLGGAVILAAILMSVVNILGRKFFNAPVIGYTAWMGQMTPVMAFLGIAYCQRLGGHIRMDIVIGQLRGRALWAAEVISVVIMLALSLALIFGSFDHALRALTFGDSTDEGNIPTWYVKMLVPVMLGVLSLRLILQLAGYGRALYTGEEEPPAVPLFEDPAAQAAHEAETVSGGADDLAPQGEGRA